MCLRISLLPPSRIAAGLPAAALAQGLELSATIYNLFDADYGDPGALEHLQDEIAQDGRAFRVRAEYRF